MVCLYLCVACRSFWNILSTHVVVTARTPRHMLLRSDEYLNGKKRKRLGSLRVPPLPVRARTMAKCPKRVLACSPEGEHHGGHVRRLVRFESHRLELGPVWWRETLQEVVIGIAFSTSVNNLVRPASLQHTSFGQHFNQPVAGVAWSVFLRQLSFGRDFNQPSVGVVGPSVPRKQSFGQCFNNPIAEVLWPVSLLGR